MSSSLALHIIDSSNQAVVCARWLGQSGTFVRLNLVLDRPPTTSADGWFCWADVSPQDAILIADASYGGGATPAEVKALALAFPPPRFWWFIIRDC